MVYPVIIVGGGFSGLVLMNMLINSGINFLLLEKLDRVGKKILATGNGRGNVSNTDLSLTHYHSNSNNFFEYAIKTYDNRLIAQFFEEKGVLLSSENNKIYPLSKQANTILDCLRLTENNNRIITNCQVKDINYNKANQTFKLITTQGNYEAKNVVLCVGGKTAPHFGTDGTSYDLATKLGHKLTKLYPSLVQLTAKKEDIKGLKGIKENATVYAFDGEKLLKKATGDILFTDSGVSGNTIFSLSSYLVDAKNPNVKIDFLPEVDTVDCQKAIKNRIKTYPNLPVSSLLSGLVHSKISQKITQSIIKNDITYSQVTNPQIDSLIYAIKNMKIAITGNLGFSNGQVTKGGIDTKDVSNTTMESKLVKGLYFAGEVLDVDGDCGGYNLQWAFSSAMCVYRSIKGEK